MIITKSISLFKRLVAFILVLITLTSALSVTVFAGDSAFMETLINTDKYTYVANLTSDTKNKNKKYAYKYMNMAYILGEGCGNNSSSGNFDLSTTNPNACFRLDQNYKYSDIADRKREDGESKLNTDRALDIFLLIEGYAKEDAQSLINDDTQISQAASAKNKYFNAAKAKKVTSPLSYPGFYNDTVTTEQSEYAQESLITLVSSLNGILAEVNDGVKFDSVADLVNKSILIRPDNANNVVKIKPNAAGYNGYVIIYADLTNTGTGYIPYETQTGQANRVLSTYRQNGGKYALSSITNSGTFLNALGLPRANGSRQLYAYVFPIDNNGTAAEGDDTIIINDASMFVYAIPKGFTEIKDTNGTVFQSPIFTEQGEVYEYTENQGDVPWVTIHMLSLYANTVYKQHNISVTTYVEPETNLFSKIIAGIFSGILAVIRSVLGLANIDTLVFNLGQRGSAAYNFGLMSENWWNVVLQYQLIFQAIAWVVLVCGFIKTLIELNLSTINPQKRMSVYETIQKFIVVGIGLVILIPAVQFLLECNNVLVELFASQIETSSLNMPSVNNVLVQFLVGMMWITILLYINFIYIMRSITVALLIASGPFFISTIAFSRGGKSSLFVSWSKELLANIFVQSVHAFVLSFLVQLLASGTFLETFAIAISIIPITEMFRNLIFAGAGGSTSQMANTAAGAMNKMGNSVIKGAMAGGAAVIGGATGEGGGGDGGGKGGGGKGNSAGNLISKAAQNKANKMGNGTSAGAKLADKMAAKAGKEEANFGMKAAGMAVDLAGMAGLGMAAMMTEMPDLQQGMADLALKGDYQGLGNAVENATKNQVSMAGNSAVAGAQGVQDKKARQAASKTPVNTKSEQMGSNAVTATSAEKGQTAAGAKVETPKVTGKKTVYERTGNTIHDVSDVSEDRQAELMAGFNAGTNQTVEDAVVANQKEGGQGMSGKKYSYTDASGRQVSFFVKGNGVSDSVKEKAETATPISDTHRMGNKEVYETKATTVAAAATEREKVGTAMAYQNRSARTTKNYLDANGSAITGGSIVTDKQGNATFVDSTTQNNASAIVQDHVNAQMATNDGAVYNQGLADYATHMSKKYDGAQGSTVDLSSRMDDGTYTDRAMIAAVGRPTETAGVYSLGGVNYNTGMTQEQATNILSTRGINGMSMQRDGSNNVTGFSYHQHQAPVGNNSFVGTQRGANGHPIAHYKTGIGQQGGPASWTSDGNGGGKMTFKNQSEAATYFQAQGNLDMARAVSNTSSGSTTSFGAACKMTNSSDGFSINFNGNDLKNNGMKMDVSANGQDLYVSSYDGQVKDPFAEQTITPEDRKQSVPSSEELTNDNLGSVVDREQLN